MRPQINPLFSNGGRVLLGDINGGEEDVVYGFGSCSAPGSPSRAPPVSSSPARPTSSSWEAEQFDAANSYDIPDSKQAGPPTTEERPDGSSTTKAAANTTPTQSRAGVKSGKARLPSVSVSEEDEEDNDTVSQRQKRSTSPRSGGDDAGVLSSFHLELLQRSLERKRNNGGQQCYHQPRSLRVRRGNSRLSRSMTDVTNSQDPATGPDASGLESIAWERDKFASLRNRPDLLTSPGRSSSMPDVARQRSASPPFLKMFRRLSSTDVQQHTCSPLPGSSRCACGKSW